MPRPAKDHRLMVEGVLWRLRTGAPWRDLPERYGPWQRGYTRFRRWQQVGVRDEVLRALQAAADRHGELDWDLPLLDGTSLRAHPHAAGAPNKGAPPRPLAGAGVAGAPSCTCGPAGTARR